MPFAGYKDFADCVRRNQDKDDPEGYCAQIQRRVEKQDMEPRRLRIVKADDEKQILVCPVLIPDVVDAQDDTISADEVEKSAHRFFREYTEGRAQLGVDHEVTLDRESAHLVESWIEKADVAYGEETIPAGSWMVAWHIPDAELWQSAKSGERSGLSMEGTGVRTPLA